MSNVSDKKLSKWLSKWLNECSYSHDCVEGNECAKAFLRVKSLIEYADQIETTYANMADEIESSAQAKQELSEEGRIRTRGVGWGRGRGGESITNKEPSEAELEEFVEKWAETFIVGFNESISFEYMLKKNVGTLRSLA